MKKQKNKWRPSVKLYFVLYTFVFLCIVSGLSAVATELVKFFTRRFFELPSVVWMLIISIPLGTALNTLTSRFFTTPITRLNLAMRAVAEGDFTVRLSSPGFIREMRESFDNFNVMAHALGTTETLQTDFISNVSHEFKTPINAIEGYTMLLQDDTQSDEEKQQCVDKILFNTRRLSELVGNILLLSKVDNQGIQSAGKAYRLDEQLRQAVVMLEHKWAEKNIELDVDLDPAMYVGNESMMLHVWTNLIDNAIKFDPHGGEMKLRLQKKDKQLIVTVADNGPGIPLEKQAHIFDRFYQVDGSHRGEGNGLGLALVKTILHSCGGEITLQSEENKGCLFTVTLPAPKEE